MSKYGIIKLNDDEILFVNENLIEYKMIGNFSELIETDALSVGSFYEAEDIEFLLSYGEWDEEEYVNEEK